MSLAFWELTGTDKGCIFTIILFYRISQFISLHVMTNDEIEWSDIFE